MHILYNEYVQSSGWNFDPSTQRLWILESTIDKPGTYEILNVFEDWNTYLPKMSLKYLISIFSVQEMVYVSKLFCGYTILKWSTLEIIFWHINV